MFVVQVGHYAWLSPEGILTTSGRHACPYDCEASAQTAADSYTGDRAAACAHMRKPLRAYHLSPNIPVTIVPLAELEARLAKNHTEPHGDGEPKRQGGGITKAIYAWAVANPNATKADAIAAFPDANRSTVAVQFSTARKLANQG